MCPIVGEPVAEAGSLERGLPPQLRNAVVRVRVELRRGESWGSGVLVAADERIGVVLTAAHVVEGARDARACKVVFVAANHAYLGTILGTERRDDLAAIAIQTPREARPVKIAAAVAPGESVVAAGFGSNTTYREYSGRVRGFVSFDGCTRGALDWSGQSRQGDSGGPVFNARGELVSIISTSGWGTSQGPACFRIRDFLESLVGGSAAPSDTPFSELESDGAETRPMPADRLERLHSAIERLRQTADGVASRVEGLESLIDKIGSSERLSSDALKQEIERIGERVRGAAELAGAARDKIEKVETVVAAIHEGSALDAAKIVWPLAASALGLSTPPTAVFVGLKVLGFYLKRKQRRSRRPVARAIRRGKGRKARG